MLFICLIINYILVSETLILFCPECRFLCIKKVNISGVEVEQGSAWVAEQELPL